MSKLEVGMYVRTNDGKITKFIEYDKKDKDELITDYYQYSTIWIKDVVKASFNIIDLIEVGDAFKFTELRTHISNKSNTKYYENYIFDVHNEEELEVIKREIKQGKIKLLEILTKEQFEHESYKVGE